MEVAGKTQAPITILIAVAVRLYRDGLAATLDAQERLCIQGSVGTYLEAQAAVRELRPDVVIIDVSLENVLSLIRTLRAEGPNSRILAFAVREDITAILDYAEAGADGFVTANGSVPELVEAIERTAAGELLCSPRVAAELLRRAAHQASRPSQHAVGFNLTGRELQVFALVKQGQSNKEIAAALNISEATVKNHVHHLLEKLQVSTRGQAMASGVPSSKDALETASSSRRAS